MDYNISQTQEDIAKKDKARKIRNILIGIIAFAILFGIIFYVIKSRTDEEGNNTSKFPIIDDVINLITNTDDKKGDEDEGKILSDSSRLVELYKGPVAGYIVLNDEKIVRVFDRSSGLIVDIDTKSGELKTVSDQPILKVHDALFINEKTIIARSLGDGNVIKSNIYSFDTAGEGQLLTQTKKPTLLSDNILELAKSQNSSYVAFVVKDASGGNIELLNTETEKMERLISLPISEWIPFVSNDGKVFISSKASKYANSGTYSVVDGELDTVVSAKIAQTTTLSPNGNISVSVSIYDNELIPTTKLVKGSNSTLYNDEKNGSEIRTIMEKCSWNSLETKLFCGVPKKLASNTPDDWYLGKVSYNDDIWLYDFVSDKSSLLLNSIVYGVEIDTISILPIGNTLYFKNKLNDHLFGYRLDKNVDIEEEVVIDPIEPEENI